MTAVPRKGTGTRTIIGVHHFRRNRKTLFSVSVLLNQEMGEESRGSHPERWRWYSYGLVPALGTIRSRREIVLHTPSAWMWNLSRSSCCTDRTDAEGTPHKADEHHRGPEAPMR